MNDEFALDPDVLYLNHAAVSPWPIRVAHAVAAFAEQNRRVGALHYPDWMKVEARLRQRLARLIGAASADSIALMKNTSEALSVIAFGLSWCAGDNVVSFSGEFPSNRLVWQALEQQGVETRFADPDAADPEAGLLALCDHRTRLVAVSSVRYDRGLRVDLERIGAYCRAHSTLFCIDAIQSLGALPFDVEAVAADYVVADGHKWLLGPEGLALFYSRPEAREQLRLLQYGWHMVEALGDFDRQDWHPARSARRFECGSPNMLGIHALDASLSLLLELGIDSISQQLLQRTAKVIEQVDQRGFTLLSSRSLARRSGIVTFSVPGVDSQKLYAALMRRRVVCAPRGGGIRFSPHGYTPLAQIERAFRTLDDVL